MPAQDDMRRRFARVAANYAAPGYHTDAQRLAEVVSLAVPRAGEVAADIATGTGNTALALAPHVGRMVGVDLTPEMLAEARRLAGERALTNVSWLVGDAQALPLGDASLDLYTARAAPHHFPDLPRALREAYRVLRPGGRAVFVDCSPLPEARDVLHQVEVRRDPSHVLSRTLDGWADLLRAAGFEIEILRRTELEWDFEAWNLRIGLAPEQLDELAAIIEGARGEAAAALRPERRAGKLWHRYWHAQIRASKPATERPP